MMSRRISKGTWQRPMAEVYVKEEEEEEKVKMAQING